MAYTTIDDPTAYFQTTLYTGTGSSQAITNTGNSDLQPDWLWIKNRDGTRDHYVYDSVRGVNKNLFPNLTNAESTDDNDLMSYNTDGFTLGGEAGVGASGETFASWQWKAGGTASSNSNGSITSSVSANTTAGFSIVSYTGTGSNATVGHGLGVAPNVIITKKRNAVQQWNFQNSMRGYNEYMALNTTEASQATGGAIISAVSSTTYSCDGNDVVNANSGTYVSYCFAEKKGYSKFGSYTGNGNADGTFVYTGFRPAFIIAKKTSSTSDWGIYDNKRNTFNVMDLRLKANSSGADDQSSDNNIDFLSNGFKHRTASGWNAAATYIYMAFAEQPFVTSTGVPATAR